MSDNLESDEMVAMKKGRDIDYTEPMGAKLEKSEVNKYEKKGRELGKLVDSKQKSYGNSVEQTFKLIKVFLDKYKDDHNVYTIPETLLKHILLQVRIIDKQNRIFNNPNGDLMDESPYKDISGYGLLGEDLADKSRK